VGWGGGCHGCRSRHGWESCGRPIDCPRQLCANPRVSLFLPRGKGGSIAGSGAILVGPGHSKLSRRFDPDAQSSHDPSLPFTGVGVAPSFRLSFSPRPWRTTSSRGRNPKHRSGSQEENPVYWVSSHDMDRSAVFFCALLTLNSVEVLGVRGMRGSDRTWLPRETPPFFTCTRWKAGVDFEPSIRHKRLATGQLTPRCSSLSAVSAVEEGAAAEEDVASGAA